MISKVMLSFFRTNTSRLKNLISISHKTRTRQICRINMTIRSSTKPVLLRSDSCSSAEINAHLQTKSLPPPEPSITSTRRIRFNNQVMVRAIEHVNDISEAEITMIWYQKEEYREIRSSLAATVRKITSGKYGGDSDSHCARGLEFRTPYGSQLRRKNKLDALVAVLDEQDRQFDMDEFCDKTLARAYMECSYARLHEAQRRGELDEIEALRIHSGEESISSLLYSSNKSRVRTNEQQEKGKVRSRIGRIFGKGSKSKTAV